MAAKNGSKPKLAPVPAALTNAEDRRKHAFERYDLMYHNLKVAQAIMDAAQAITDPLNGSVDDSLFSDRTLPDLLAHGRNLLDLAQSDAREVYECFKIERKAAEASHG